MPDPAPTITPTTPAPDPITVTAPVTTQATDPNASTQAPQLEKKQAAETFDALNKLFDEPAPVSPTVTSEAAPTAPTGTEPAKPTPVGADDFQSKLDAAKAPMGAHPNVAAGLESLKSLAQAEHAKAEALQTKIKDYEAMALEFQELKSGNKLPEPVEKELTGLRERFRETDYQATPDFQKNYVQPVREAETTVMDLLKQANLPENVSKFIQENGGIIALSQSGELAGQKDAPEMTMAEWVDRKLIGALPSVFKNRILGKLTQAQDAMERGRADLTDFRANSKERYDTRMKQMEADFNAGRDEAIAEAGDLAKPIIISPTATAEERVAAERHNTMLRQAAEKYDAYLKAQKDPRTSGKLLAKATQADVMMSLYQESQVQVKALQAKLEGIKSAGSHSLAGSHSPPPGTEKPSNSDLLKKSTDSAMNDLFKTIPSLQ